MRASLGRADIILQPSRPLPSVATTLNILISYTILGIFIKLLNVLKLAVQRATVYTRPISSPAIFVN